MKPEWVMMAPLVAVRNLMEKTGENIETYDLIELNEAFSAQGCALTNELKINPEKLNVNGGAVALGHPLGCTGAKLTATALHELKRRNGKYATVTMCIGTGLGAARIFEAV